MIPVVLTIAGSDSGGGAGIQADLKTFQAFGCFGTTAITAVTVQDTRGVRGVHRVPVETVVAQVRAVAEDLHPAACKSGMLGTGEAVRALAAALDRLRLPRYVLDPVMVATSGDRLLDREGERAVLDELLPRAAVVTPNLDEASLLVGFPVRDVASMARAAEVLVSRGARAALVKGGHLESDALVDLLWDGAEWREWRRPRLVTRNTHGTGCTLSAAIAAGLARGHDLPRAVGDALDYVRRAIEAAPGLGSGHGPLNHGVAWKA